MESCLYKSELGLPLQQAVERAVNECIKEGILADFLSRDKAEAIMFSMYEHNEEEEWRKFREAEREYGRELGLGEAVRNLMKNTNMTEEEAKKVLGII